MSGVQTTIPFLNRKKSFYGNKENTLTEKVSTLRNAPSVKYTPTVKKLVAISSSESESDTDLENNSLETKIVSSRPRRKRGSNETKISSAPKQKKIAESNRSPEIALKQVESTNITPKSLFGTGNYCKARKALHISSRETLPGRESEIEKLDNFIQEHLDNGSSGSLYVSGPPGTGKTACLFKVMEKPIFKKSFKIIYINCTSMKSAITIYAEIAKELGLKLPKTRKSSKIIVEKYLSSTHKMLLIILDEMDQLESKNQSVLYSIFEWPGIPQSKLVLIGIANALDLTDRILPRLQSRIELMPQLMCFTPYTKQQITKIISERLNSANVSELFSPVAIQLLAGKVAAVSGDIRRALDISRRGIEIAETQQKAQILQLTNDNGSNADSNQPDTTKDKTVDIKNVLSVLNCVYGGLQNVDNNDDSFPLQQKIVLCSLMLILNKGKNKDITIGKLHEVYSKVCVKKKISPTDISEFVNLCSLIETRGVLKMTIRKDMRLSKIILQWDQEELSSALQDKVLLSEILNDTSCL